MCILHGACIQYTHSLHILLVCLHSGGHALRDHSTRQIVHQEEDAAALKSTKVSCYPQGAQKVLKAQTAATAAEVGTLLTKVAHMVVVLSFLINPIGASGTIAGS